jgi:hypothetical protein
VRPAVKDDHDDTRSLGVSVLDDLRVNLSRDDIAGYLAEFGAGTGYDSATRRLLEATAGHVDLHAEGHRLALIGWLRAWGCRHLRRADTPRTAEALRTWWETWAARLPGEQATLNGLSQTGLTAAGQAYESLRSAPAAARTVQGRDVAVTFGDTATAKAMFAIRPRAFLPWDEPIRLAFGPPGGGVTYVKLLQLAAAALEGLAQRLGASIGDLPELLGRPESSPPKLVDEYLWIRITRDRQGRARA